MQRYQTEDEHRKAMRAKINKTIKRGKRRKRIIRRLRKAVPGICIGVLIAGMGVWCIAAPLPDPDDYEPYRFQAENGQWYTQEEYEQMSQERDAYHQREREEAEKEAQMIRDYQEQYQKDQEAEWKLYQEQTRTGLIHSMDFDASDAYLLEKIAMAEAESEDTEGKALSLVRKEALLGQRSIRRPRLPTYEHEGRQETMIIQLEIPKEFAKDYANNRFDDFFRRVYADIDNEGMCGNYEGETAQMMARAFKESRCLDYEKTR